MTSRSPLGALRSRIPLPLILLAVGLIALAAVLAACGEDGDGEDGGGAEELLGLFGIDAGVCDATTGLVTSGSFFAMTDADSNGVPNESGREAGGPDEGCDPTNDPLSPGTDGGLKTGEFQPLPDPAFDAGGNGLAGAIHEPRLFFTINYGSATQADVIPTGGTDQAPLPSITHDGDGNLSGDLSAFVVAWQTNFFAQGMPRPAGLPENSACDEAATASTFANSTPAAPVTGTYDSDTGEYTLDWFSRIGAAFGCQFTGHWHFEGTFTPSGGEASPSS